MTPRASRCTLVILVTRCLALFSSAAEVSESKYSFDVPSGEAKPMLRQFAAQAKREIIFAIESVERVRTNAVKGEMTAQAAINQMLTNTGLVAAQDPRTGAFAVRKESADETKNGQRAARTARDRPAN